MTDNINTFVLNLPFLIVGRKMACRSLFLYCMFFALLPSGAASSRITETLDNNSDWKFSMKKNRRTPDDRQVLGRSYIIIRE